MQRTLQVHERANTQLWRANFCPGTDSPMGVFEFPNFANGTKAVGEAVAEATTKGATTIIGTEAMGTPSKRTPLHVVALGPC